MKKLLLFPMACLLWLVSFNSGFAQCPNPGSSEDIVLSDGAFYNYGDPNITTLFDFSVCQDGLLAINQSGATGLNGAGPNSISGSYFTVNSGSGVDNEYTASNVTVLDGGEFKVVGGIVNVDKGSTILIKKGGLLKLQSASKIIIHPGASLVIEDDASIALWDGQGSNGRASIEVYGTLEVQGDFDFSGNGCFRFFPGNSLSLTGKNKFRLRGENKNWRFIEVMDNATLDSGNGKLRLVQGTIDLNGNGKIFSGPGGSARYSSVKIEGGEINASQTTSFLVMNSDVESSELFIENVTKSDALALLLNNSTFISTIIHTFNCEVARVYSCDIDLAGNSYLAFEDTHTVRLNDSEVSNAANEAIILSGRVPEFVMSSGRLYDNNTAIWATDLEANGAVNIFLNSKAEIEGNTTGIFFADITSESQYHSDSRLVHLDCARLLGNETGVYGKDVLLQIDGYENSATNNPSYLRSNYFENGGLLFDICYTYRDVTAVSATGNYWGALNPNIETSLQSVWRQISTDCATTVGVEIQVDVSNKVLSVPNNCPSKPDGTVVIEIPDDKKCELSIDEIQTLPGSMGVYAPEVTGSDATAMTHDQLAVAFESFNVKLEVDEKTDEAKALFAQVANISDEQRDASSDVCKQNIDVARVMVSILATSQNLASPNSSENVLPLNQGITDGEKTLDNPLIKVFPNPANNQLNVQLQTGNYHLQLSDLTGRVFYIEDTKSSVKINTEKMDSGIYILSIINLDTNEKEMKKVILQH